MADIPRSTPAAHVEESTWVRSLGSTLDSQGDAASKLTYGGEQPRQEGCEMLPGNSDTQPRFRPPTPGPHYSEAQWHHHNLRANWKCRVSGTTPDLRSQGPHFHTTQMTRVHTKLREALAQGTCLCVQLPGPRAHIPSALPVALDFNLHSNTCTLTSNQCAAPGN